MKPISALFLMWVALTVQLASRQDPSARRRPEPAELKNPVPATATSLAAGGTLYNRNCAGCHGKTGLGDGPAGALLNPKPSNLVDAEWNHGASDGEIFATVRGGVARSPMKSFASRMTDQDIWHVINYLRSLGPAPQQ